jgi:hypothetical protein
VPEIFAENLNRKRRKKTRRDYKTQADLLFSAAIRQIGYCEECGTTEHLQCAHIISRSYSAIRTNFLNAVCLCRSCHMFYTPRPLEWEQWARDRIGDLNFELLRKLALADYPLKLDWKAEVDRLRIEAPMIRPEPSRFRR